MTTLTKKLHILKTGWTEEACNIYTTPEEVGGSPYLSVLVDGQKGYVKLGSTTDANATHLKVKKNDTTYAVLRQATVDVPTGSIQVHNSDMFTVPPGVEIIKVYFDEYEYDDISHSVYTYVGVTPGKTYRLGCYTYRVFFGGNPDIIVTDGAWLESETSTWFMCEPVDEIEDYIPARGFELSWSPEINKMTPTYTDY